MEDSDVLPYLPTEYMPPLRQTRRQLVNAWLEQRRSYRVLRWGSRKLQWLAQPLTNKLKSQWHFHPRRLVALSLLLVLVPSIAAGFTLNIHTNSSATVGAFPGSINSASITTSSTSDTAGTCTVASNGQSASCSGTNLAVPSDTYTITFVVASSSAPSCSVVNSGVLTGSTPTVTGTSSPFTVSTTVSASGSGSGSVTVDC